MSIRIFARSIHCAIKGLRLIFKEEQNFRLEIAGAFGVLFLSFMFHVTRSEFFILLVMIFFVLTIEIINTIVERLLDMLKPRLHMHVEVIKDMMAGAVLCVSMIAAIIGFMIFIPYILEFLFSQ